LGGGGGGRIGDDTEDVDGLGGGGRMRDGFPAGSADVLGFEGS
jgi:hypothetical protein